MIRQKMSLLQFAVVRYNIYIYLYIYICVCVCVCVFETYCLTVRLSWKMHLRKTMMVFNFQV